MERDLAYNQGTAWVFLLQYYVKVGFRLHGPSFANKAEWLVKGCYEDISKHGVGAFSELYDGDPPQEPHGAVASALSTAALLTVNHLIDQNKEDAK